MKIVKGDIAAAAEKIHGVLKSGLYLAIELLGRLINIKFVDGIRHAISGLGEQVRGAIKKFIQKIAWAGKQAAGTVKEWLKLREKFTTKEGIRHTIYIRERKGSYNLMIASTRMKVSSFLKNMKEKVIASSTIDGNEKRRLLGEISEIQRLTKQLRFRMNDSREDDHAKIGQKIVDIRNKIKELDFSSTETEQGPTFIRMKDGETFSIGDQVQITKGRGYLRGPHYIVEITRKLINGESVIMISYGKNPPDIDGATSALLYPKTWRRPEAYAEDLPSEKLIEENRKESWDQQTVAKKVLNYRVHEIQHVNPRGKDWEHVVEKSTGGAHSSKNLVLLDSGLNKKLGSYYGEARRYPMLALEDIDEPVVLREYLRGKSESVQEEWKLKIYREVFRAKLSGFKNKGRGKYREVE